MSSLTQETLAQLKSLINARSDWGKIIEDYVHEFGGINSATASSLSQEQLKKLWWASRFAETGAPGVTKPIGDQWQYLRDMTGLLADESLLPGDRICKVLEEYKTSFKNLPANVILRTLLILEGGKYGTVTTKFWINLLLKEIGKQELDFGDPTSVTLALRNLKALI